MIYASDLDQTLIYSIRSRRLSEDEPYPKMTVVEQRENREISYMTDKAIALLKEVHSKIMFMPVTTRTMEQYKKIGIFQRDIIPPFAVTSNGGNILVNGEVDSDWTSQIQTKLSNEALPKEALLEMFRELMHEEWILSERTADDLFHYFIINPELAPRDELSAFKAIIGNHGWNMSLQGRKLYLVPQTVNKWAAVAYIKEKLGKTFVVASGDSLLDLCMLEVADYAIAPLHGELSGKEIQTKGSIIHRTKRRGIYAAEDILEEVLAVMEQGISNKM